MIKFNSVHATSKTFFAIVLLALGVAANPGIAGGISELTAGELATLISEGKATAIDANAKWYREKNGVIPGAILLSNYSRFNASEELPTDKDVKLVFYCSNKACSASHIAGRKAKDAGYADVNILPVGLSGWKKAGYEVENI